MLRMLLVLCSLYWLRGRASLLRLLGLPPSRSRDNQS